MVFNYFKELRVYVEFDQQKLREYEIYNLSFTYFISVKQNKNEPQNT